MAGYVLKIVLENTHPPVWRRIIIPDKITFADLHEIIQVLFEWENAHLHSFEIPSNGICIQDGNVFSGNDYLESETLIDPFIRAYKWIRYTYDFGDDWRHKIIIEKTEVYEERFATLLKFKGDHFAEDCGGIRTDADWARCPFDKDKTERQLQIMVFPIKPDLKEPILQKNSLSQLMNQFKQLAANLPENFLPFMNNRAADNFPSSMASKIDSWNSFSEQNGLEPKNSLSLITPYKTHRELLADLGRQETLDFYKYLQLPKQDHHSPRQQVDAIAEILRLHPEYLLYLLEENEYSALLKWKTLPAGIISQMPPTEAFIMKLLMLGLADFYVKNGSGFLSFASDLDLLIKGIDQETEKRTYQLLQQFDERLGVIMQVYCVVELEHLYQMYCHVYHHTPKKEDFFRLIYWHARLNNFITTGYQMDGVSYAVHTDIDVEQVLKKETIYAKDLPYADYSLKELQYLTEDLSNRSSWIDMLFSALHYQLNLDAFEAQQLLFEIVLDVLNGDTLNQLIDKLKDFSKKTWTLSFSTELWAILSGLLLELELPMLRGRCRVSYANEQKISPWSISMVETPEHTENTRQAHIYEFPIQIQEWMYEAVTLGDEHAIQQLMEYKANNHILSEEFLALLAAAGIICEKTQIANELIAELKNGSKDGKIAAKNLESRLQESYFIDDGKEDWEPFYSNNALWDCEQEPGNQSYVRQTPKIGRNAPCPCGSGKKYKKCCGKT